MVRIIKIGVQPMARTFLGCLGLVWLLTIPCVALAAAPPSAASSTPPATGPTTAPPTTAPPKHAPPTQALPAGTIAARTIGHIMVVATADGRLITYDVTSPASPRKLAERKLDGDLIALRAVDGVVFAVVAERRILALVPGEGGRLVPWQPRPPVALGTAHGVATAAPSSSQAETVVGTVSKVRYGTLLVKLSSIGAVKPGDQLLVRSQQRGVQHNLFTGRAEEVISNAPVALIEVRQVHGDRAEADLERGDQAHAGDTVERADNNTQRTWGSRWVARRADYTQWVRGTLRPVLNFGKVDVGSVTDLSWGLQRGVLLVQARVAPLGLSVPYGVDAINAHAIVSYATDVAAFGIGAGYWRHHFQARSESQCTESGFVAGAADEKTAGDPTVPPVFNCRQSGPSVVQHLRLGSVDGLNLELINALAIQGGRFSFGYLEGHLDVPLRRALNLYVAGGGSTGIQWGELGIRTYFRGVGGPETFILTTAIGGSSMRTKALYDVKTGSYNDGKTTYIESEENSIGGLHITVGLEYRY